MSNHSFYSHASPLRYGLALSGGGTRGFAHLGVLRALEEHQITPSIVAGVSAGAIIGALYCLGKKPHEIAKIFQRTKAKQFLSLNLHSASLLKTTKLQDLIQSLFRDLTFEDLHTPLLVITTNLLTGEVCIFDKGPLWLPIMASCSLPVIFPPVTIAGQPYVDGGVLKNFPVTPLKGKCDFIIGSNVNPGICQETPFKENLFAITERVYKLIVRSNAKIDSDYCHLEIAPKALEKYSVYDTKHKKNMIHIGYQETRKILCHNTSWKPKEVITYN